MDSDRGSNSGSSRHGSMEPDFLYETPLGDQAVWDPRAMPVCSRCGRQFYGHVPLPARNRIAAICPVCSLQESRERAQQRAPDDDFYTPTGYYHVQRGRPAERALPSHVPRQADDHRHGRQRVHSTAIHVVGRAFPSCGGPIPSRHAPQPYPPSAWTNPDPLPQFTPVTGSYRPPYQLPRLIAQVQQRSSPANDISRPRTADPYGVSSSRYTHHRQQ